MEMWKIKFDIALIKNEYIDWCLLLLRFSQC